MSFIFHYRRCKDCALSSGAGSDRTQSGSRFQSKTSTWQISITSPSPLVQWYTLLFGKFFEAHSTCNVHITGAAACLPKAAAKQEPFACECSPDLKCQLFLQRTSGLGLKKEAKVPVLDSKADSSSGIQGEVVSVEPAFNGIFMCCLGF